MTVGEACEGSYLEVGEEPHDFPIHGGNLVLPAFGKRVNQGLNLA
jgi:hypothetical protein